MALRLSALLVCVCEMMALGCSSRSTGDARPAACAPSSMGACTDGAAVLACITTNGDGTCANEYYSVGAATFTCASCSDCAGAILLAERACSGGVGPEEEAGIDAARESGGPPGFDASGPADAGSDTGTDAGSDGGDAGVDGSGDADAGDVCGTVPSLHPESVAGVYCPFTSAGNIHCPAGDECCEPMPGSGSTCQAGGAVCPVPGSASWQCEDPIDCSGSASGPVCCGSGTVELDSTCGFYRGAGFVGSHCATSCGASEIILCEATTECPGTCMPFKTQGLALGTCM
jgi:hypothetical protein